MRGEYACCPCTLLTNSELPPRARRIHMPGAVNSDIAGTTSACAENTYLGWGSLCVRWNYLRVRGEYHDKPAGPQASAELPPRARRIPSPHQFRVPRRGTTSACAENTVVSGRNFFPLWNYLRVRGEYLITLAMASILSELPPRARRILHNPSPNRL